MYTDEEKELMAINTIRNYLNKDFTDEEIKTKFGLALKRIINNFDTMTSSSGVKSMTQGSMSVTYTDEKKYITDDIALLLPRPYIKLF